MLKNWHIENTSVRICANQLCTTTLPKHIYLTFPKIEPDPKSTYNSSTNKWAPRIPWGIVRVTRTLEGVGCATIDFESSLVAWVALSIFVDY
jgi:hypothetical protein